MLRPKQKTAKTGELSSKSIGTKSDRDYCSFTALDTLPVSGHFLEGRLTD
jgi:hypothetical protein